MTIPEALAILEISNSNNLDKQKLKKIWYKIQHKIHPDLSYTLTGIEKDLNAEKLKRVNNAKKLIEDVLRLNPAYFKPKASHVNSTKTKEQSKKEKDNSKSNPQAATESKMRESRQYSYAYKKASFSPADEESSQNKSTQKTEGAGEKNAPNKGEDTEFKTENMQKDTTENSEKVYSKQKESFYKKVTINVLGSFVAVLSLIIIGLTILNLTISNSTAHGSSQTTKNASLSSQNSSEKSAYSFYPPIKYDSVYKSFSSSSSISKFEAVSSAFPSNYTFNKDELCYNYYGQSLFLKNPEFSLVLINLELPGFLSDNGGTRLGSTFNLKIDKIGVTSYSISNSEEGIFQRDVIWDGINKVSILDKFSTGSTRFYNGYLTIADNKLTFIGNTSTGRNEIRCFMFQENYNLNNFKNETTVKSGGDCINLRYKYLGEEDYDKDYYVKGCLKDGTRISYYDDNPELELTIKGMKYKYIFVSTDKEPFNGWIIKKVVEN